MAQWCVVGSASARVGTRFGKHSFFIRLHCIVSISVLAFSGASLANCHAVNVIFLYIGVCATARSHTQCELYCNKYPQYVCVDGAEFFQTYPVLRHA